MLQADAEKVQTSLDAKDAHSSQLETRNALLQSDNDKMQASLDAKGVTAWQLEIRIGQLSKINEKLKGEMALLEACEAKVAEDKAQQVARLQENLGL